MSTWQTTALFERLRLTVEKVIHHDDVYFAVFAVVIDTRGDAAGGDPHSGYDRVVELDAEEGKVTIARRGRNKAAEQQFTIGIETLDKCGPAA